ncbi:GAF domain-containing protein [Lapillicoccus jejuensis]|uniref:GAF domain-containing protein n=1 Tax=Lapillicoccus jejuensis TaxID=402171 RepID=A0A542DZ25_9MICO|nr:GAF domain-containing protein [Lapillicoccus jejuensis]TQJ08306.1 GAF domain-containing protein [Lapillicoccus jejuensis]
MTLPMGAGTDTTTDVIDPGADPAQDPVGDVDRLLAVARYDVESPELAAVLDRYAGEAADLFGLPIGAVSIVLDGAQYFAGQRGLDGSWMGEAAGTPIEWSFCATTVRTRAPYVVPDATVDEVQRTNPLVLLDGVRSYAGAPLITSSGHVLGACCTLGYEPREFSADEIALLERLSDRIVADLEHFLVD